MHSIQKANKTISSVNKTQNRSEIKSKTLLKKESNNLSLLINNNNTTSLINNINSANSKSLQLKIKIGKPNDKFEQEADSMADKVMSSPSTLVGNIQKQEKEEPQAKEIINRQEEEEPQAKELINRQEEEEPQAKEIINRQEEEEPQAKEIINRQEEEEPQAKELINRQEEEEPQAKEIINRQEEEEPQAKELISRQEEEEPQAKELISRQEEEEPQAKEIINRQEEEEPQAKELINRQEEEEPQAKEIINRQEEEEPQAKEIINRQEEEEPQAKELISRQEEEEPQAKEIISRQEEEEPVQTKPKKIVPSDKKKKGIKYKLNINNPEEEAKEEVQTKSSGHSRKSSSLQLKSGKSTNAGSSSFESDLKSSKGGGAPLPDSTRSFMENKFDADFSGVRIHTGSDAATMSSQINAQAFTHGNDIYFNQGKYDIGSSQGKGLIAHELTHTIQQGASVQGKSAARKVQKKSKAVSKSTENNIQRSWLGDAWDAVSDVASSVVESVTDTLESGLNWIKDKFHDFVEEIPGYKLLSVVLGKDPVSGDPVERSGRNFIEAGLDIIPFGSHFKQKLEETGALEEAATWLDGQIAGLDISLTTIKAEISAFWDSLSLSDIGDPSGVLERASKIIRNPIGKIITFAGNVATEFLRIVKNYVLSELVLFIKTNTRGYPLLTVILAKDPITEEPVERNGMNLIKGFMLLSADGAEQLRQMVESGSLQKAADWIDTTIAELDLSWETIRNLFSSAWDLISIENLMTPIETFQKLVTLFAEPVGRIIKFVIKVGLKILEFIKAALLKRLSDFAHKTRGFHLITVILGKNPFTGEVVKRTAENIIRGFMGLMEGGEEQYQQMKQTGAIAQTLGRIEAAVATLGFTWEYIVGLFTQAWNSFSLKDLAAPLEAFARIVKLFANPIMRLFVFIWEILKIVIEVLLIIMKFPIDLVKNIIAKSMQAINDIKRDPIGFLKNILRAIKQGFVQFFDNILKHLIKGVTGWLFGELKDAGINPPQDFSLKSILGFVLEILGITMDRIWKKLAEKIGQDKVDKIKKVIDTLSGIWSFIRDVATKGPSAIWEYIVEKISNLWDTVLDAVKNWVMTKIVEKVVTKLLSLLDPTGIMAVVNSVIAIYNAIESFIRYIKEMLAIVNSFVEGVAEIAKGNVKKAADFIEGAMSKSMPVIIGFLANQVGLGGVGKKVSEMIEKVRKKVDDAIGWLIDKAIGAGKAFLDMLKRGVAAVKKGVASLFQWWKTKKKFKAKDGKTHSIYFKSKGQPKLFVASEEQGLDDIINKKNGDQYIISDETVRQGLLQKYTNLKTYISENADKQEKTVKPGTTVESASTKDLSVEIDRRLKEIYEALPLSVFQDTDEKMPLSNVTYSMSDGRSSEVIAEPLSNMPGNTKGSAPGEEPIGWDYIKNVVHPGIPGKSTSHVQIHLLSERLHGPGKRWNLTPGKTGYNTPGGMLIPETEAQKRINKDSKDPAQPRVISYKVKVSYYTSNDPIYDAPGNEIDTNTKNLYSHVKQSFFPKKIDVVIENMRKDNDNWVKTGEKKPYAIPDSGDMPLPKAVFNLDDFFADKKATMRDMGAANPFRPQKYIWGQIHLNTKEDSMLKDKFRDDYDFSDAYREYFVSMSDTKSKREELISRIKQIHQYMVEHGTITIPSSQLDVIFGGGYWSRQVGNIIEAAGGGEYKFTDKVANNISKL